MHNPDHNPDAHGVTQIERAPQPGYPSERYPGYRSLLMKQGNPEGNVVNWRATVLLAVGPGYRRLDGRRALVGIAIHLVIRGVHASGDDGSSVLQLRPGSPTLDALRRGIVRRKCGSAELLIPRFRPVRRNRQHFDQGRRTRQALPLGVQCRVLARIWIRDRTGDRQPPHAAGSDAGREQCGGEKRSESWGESHPRIMAPSRISRRYLCGDPCLAPFADLQRFALPLRRAFGHDD